VSFVVDAFNPFTTKDTKVHKGKASIEIFWKGIKQQAS
jgi:hypothetical protein